MGVERASVKNLGVCIISGDSAKTVEALRKGELALCAGGESWQGRHGASHQ